MTLVLLDTNAYLRLAKRVRPMLGAKFGQKEYVLTVLKEVETEVHRNPTLRFRYPWFDVQEFSDERLAKAVRLSAEERAKIDAAQSVLHNAVLGDVAKYTRHGRSPPSSVDCRLLAFGQVRPAIVVTDDLGMHDLAAEFEIDIWHGPDLLSKMRSAKMVTNALVREIYDALERNSDLTETWAAAKHTMFVKVFGPAPKKGR